MHTDINTWGLSLSLIHTHVTHRKLFAVCCCLANYRAHKLLCIYGTLDKHCTLASFPAGAMRIDGGDNHFSRKAVFSDNAADNGDILIRNDRCVSVSFCRRYVRLQVLDVSCAIVDFASTRRSSCLRLMVRRSQSPYPSICTNRSRPPDNFKNCLPSG